MQIVLTMAGEGSRFKKYGYKKPKFLIRVLGKTLLQYSLESLPLNKAKVVVLVLLKSDYLKDECFNEISRIKNLYSDVNFQMGIIPERTDGQAITANMGCDFLSDEEPLIIYNIDTYFKFDYRKIFKDNGELIDCDGGIVLGVKKEGDSWSFAETDSHNNVLRTAEKNRISNNALVGFYLFSKLKYFREALNKEIKSEQKHKEFYVAPLYNYLIEDSKVIKFFEVNEFVPLGTPQEVFEYIRLNSKRTKPRSFNQININKNSQLFTKSSENVGKIISEKYWCNHISNKFPKISQFLPKIIEKNDEELTMEFLPLKSLSEYFLYEVLSKDDIEIIFNKLFFIISSFREEFNSVDITESYDLISGRHNLLKVKNLMRLKRLNEIEFFKDFMSYEPLFVNGEYLNFSPKRYYKLLESLYLTNDNFSIIHGDFCFPNILFDNNTKVVKLVDPRGELYNDLYYDLAKIRHSLSGYDLIVNGFYNLNRDGKNFNYQIFWNNNFNLQTLELFDNKLEQKGFNLNKVKAIEATLFLSMIPLHSEDFKRQKMFFILALEKFRDILWKI